MSLCRREVESLATRRAAVVKQSDIDVGDKSSSNVTCVCTYDYTRDCEGM